ncbi:MAG TPA: hypothetical protein ENG51_07575 [Deltaproteobacteria bacterium]|nr:hypothetical protein [Deltaproteobacteria bacterium]
MNKYVLYLDGQIDYTLGEDDKYKEIYRGKVVVPSDENKGSVYFHKDGSLYLILDQAILTEFIEPLVEELKDARTTFSEPITKRDRHEPVINEEVKFPRTAPTDLTPGVLLKLLDKVSADDLLRLREKGLL